MSYTKSRYVLGTMAPDTFGSTEIFDPFYVFDGCLPGEGQIISIALKNGAGEIVYTYRVLGYLESLSIQKAGKKEEIIQHHVIVETISLTGLTPSRNTFLKRLRELFFGPPSLVPSWPPLNISIPGCIRSRKLELSAGEKESDYNSPLYSG
jgi:hypothetical protein